MDGNPVNQALADSLVMQFQIDSFFCSENSHLRDLLR